MIETLPLEWQDLVLDALIARLEVQVPQALIDEEVRHCWGQLEGDADEHVMSQASVKYEGA